MALAYRGVAAQDLPQTGLVHEYRQQLFKDYIKGMFHRPIATQQYEQTQVMCWHAAERIFLQKVGGGYIFIHRLLMEHFARMDLEQVRR